DAALAVEQQHAVVDFVEDAQQVRFGERCAVAADGAMARPNLVRCLPHGVYLLLGGSVPPAWGGPLCGGGRRFVMYSPKRRPRQGPAPQRLSASTRPGGWR